MLPVRKRLRWAGYDYHRAGFYFVTLCCHERSPLLGRIADGQMVENELGVIVRRTWDALPSHHRGVELDALVVMPDHVHGVIRLAGRPDPPDDASPPGLGTVIGSFKASAARQINVHRGTPGAAVWQRGYHEHVVRNEGDLRCVREYVSTNPSRLGSVRHTKTM